MYLIKVFLLIIMCLPTVVFAMEPLNEENLEEVTGKAGISCFFANGGSGKVGMNVSFGKLVIGNISAENYGYLSIYGANTINDTTPANSGISFSVENSFLTFDVYTLRDSGITKIRMGLPTLTSESSLADYYKLNISNTPTTDGHNLGVVYTGGTEVTIPKTPTAIEIWGH